MGYLLGKTYDDWSFSVLQIGTLLHLTAVRRAAVGREEDALWNISCVWCPRLGEPPELSVAHLAT